MALKGNHNHYNVKFLKGYGHSISVKDSKIILKNCYDPFSKPSVSNWFAFAISGQLSALSKTPSPS